MSKQLTRTLTALTLLGASTAVAAKLWPSAVVVLGAGTSVFTFKAAQPGSTALTLNYARSFEPNNPPGQTFSVPVTVK